MALADALLIGGALLVWWSMDGAAPTAPGKVTMKLDPQTALEIINRVNAEQGGWHDPRDVLAVIAVESGFNTNARGSSGEYGLMQIMPATAGDYGVTDLETLYDPETNIRVGMAHLKWTWEYLEKRLGYTPSEEQWLSAYNGGVGNVSKGWLSMTYPGKVARAREAFTLA